MVTPSCQKLKVAGFLNKNVIIMVIIPFTLVAIKINKFCLVAIKINKFCLIEDN